MEMRAPAPVAVLAPIPNPPPASLPSGAPKSPYAKKPTGNRIEFKIIDGYAVSYGDVLLGKPETPIPSGHGSYDAPVPQFWDRGEVPYAINPDLPNPQRVEAALQYFMEHTSLKFIPYSGQHDAIVFEPGTEHCFSALGRVGGLQPIKLAAGCGTQEIMHEVMHALGFVHEQSRSDRDRYVEILWDNIQPDFQIQFAIVPDSFMEAEKDTPFDYHSIMIYPPASFALSPGLNTMKSIGPDAISPPASGLSDGDLRRIDRTYGISG
jgi:hypothetical protein